MKGVWAAAALCLAATGEGMAAEVGAADRQSFADYAASHGMSLGELQAMVAASGRVICERDWVWPAQLVAPDLALVSSTVFRDSVPPACRRAFFEPDHCRVEFSTAAGLQSIAIAGSAASGLDGTSCTTGGVAAVPEAVTDEWTLVALAEPVQGVTPYALPAASGAGASAARRLLGPGSGILAAPVPATAVFSGPQLDIAFGPTIGDCAVRDVFRQAATPVGLGTDCDAGVFGSGGALLDLATSPPTLLGLAAFVGHASPEAESAAAAAQTPLRFAYDPNSTASYFIPFAGAPAAAVGAARAERGDDAVPPAVDGPVVPIHFGDIELERGWVDFYRPECGTIPASWQPRIQSVIEAELAKYPADLLARTLSGVAVCRGLSFDGYDYSGTWSYVMRRVFMAVTALDDFELGEVRFILHHEFSSGLLLGFTPRPEGGFYAAFPAAEWTAFNDAAGYVGIDGADALRNGGDLDLYDAPPALLSRGFVTGYGSNSLEEDFNTYAEQLMATPAAFRRLVETYPRVCAKTKVFAAYYRGLGIDFPQRYVDVDCDAIALPRDMVRELQGYLVGLGYDTGGVDGLAGPRTRAAIEAVEARLGLPVTGMARLPVLMAVMGLAG